MKKTLRIITLISCLAILFGCVASVASVSAMTPYSTYTYSQEGFGAASPDAYTPDTVLYSKDLALAEGDELKDPRDLFVDRKTGYVYIADTKNNRIVVTNEYLKTMFTISEFTNSQGVPDGLSNPQGVYVRHFDDGLGGDDCKIYIADTNNARIVVFDFDYIQWYSQARVVERTPSPIPESVFEAPESDVFPEGSVYKPSAIAVDDAGRMYVVSSTTYMGVITLNPDGSFVGFIGAQAVNLSVLDMIWRKFQTKEQRQNSQQYVSTEFNNITIDSGNFIYVTSNSIEESLQQASTNNKEAKNAPVKKLNANGIDVLKRNGFYGPGGEVTVAALQTGTAEEQDTSEQEDKGTTTTTLTKKGASSIIDVAVGPGENTWSIIDEKRSKIYTYDNNGELLYVFGDSGLQTGNISKIRAIDYQGTDILILDSDECSITIFKRTEYGDLLAEALENRQNREYEKTLTNWQRILQRNSNFDAAYIGIGNSLRNDAKYEEAMGYYEYAYDTENWSEAYKNLRENWIYKYPYVIILVVIAVILIYWLIFHYAGKVNVAGQTKTERRTFWEEIVYGFWILFHPFDGFWDLKHEQRGSIRASIVWIIIVVASFQYKSMSSGYLLNPDGKSANVITTVLSVLLPIFLWCISNWCLTTLFDGEGTFRDIFIATSYSLVPIALFMVPITIMSHFVLLSEVEVLTFVMAIAYVWTGFLIFFGSMVTHDYSFAKNVAVCVGSIAGIAFILFLVLLFVSLINKIIGFVYSIIAELYTRSI